MSARRGKTTHQTVLIANRRAGFPPWTTIKRAHRYVAEGQAEFVSLDPPLLRLVDQQQLMLQRRQQAGDEQERRLLAGLAFHWFTMAGPDGTVGVHAKAGGVARWARS